MFTYDKAKRRENLDKHGIDLAQCAQMFDQPMLTIEDSRMAYGEPRFKSLGLLEGRVAVLIWTERSSGARLISCRYGDKHETNLYFCTAF